MSEEDSFKCVHCQKIMTPNSAFLDMISINKKNVQKIKEEHALEMAKLNQQTELDCEEKNKVVKGLEKQLANERKVHEMILADYEEKLKQTPDDDTSSDVVVEIEGEENSVYLEENKKLVAKMKTVNEESEKLTGELSTLRVEREVLVDERDRLRERLNDLEKSDEEWDDLQTQIEKEKRMVEISLKRDYEKQLLENIEKERERLREKFDEAVEKNLAGMFKENIPFDEKFVSQLADDLTTDYIRGGAKGLANFLADGLKSSDCKSNYLCTDMVQKKFSYFSKNGWTKDKKCKMLGGVLFKAVLLRCQDIVKEMKGDDRDDELIGEILKVSSLIKKKDREFFDDFIDYLAPLISIH